MTELVFSGACRGIGVSHIIRDCDFTETTGYYRNEYQIHYICEGERFFFISQRGYKMVRGAIAFIDKRQIPTTNVVGGKFHNRLLIELEESWLLSMGEAVGFDLLRFFQDYHGVFLLNEEEQKYMQKNISVLENSVGKEGEFCEAQAKIAVIQMILRVCAGMGVRAPECRFPQEKMMRYMKVHDITDYIVGHCEEISSLDELARLFYIDKSYLSRIFKEVTNFTVNEFINCQRIGKARLLLAETEKTMEEVAKELGYDSLAYFDRVFKKYTDMTPLQYRKMKKKR